MSEARTLRPYSLRMGIALPCVALVALSGLWLKRHKTYTHDSVINYEVKYKAPVGWKAVPHAPQTLFLYKNPADKVLLRGSVNQIISEINPTPELDTDGIAKFYIDRTHDNMKDWTATQLDSAQEKDFDFAVIRRAKAGRTVITAFAVKGNTTVLVSMSGEGKDASAADAELPYFYGYLKTISLSPQDMSKM